MTAIIPACNAPAMSSASSVGVGSGGSEAMPFQSEIPRAMPATVTPRIPRITAPGTRRAASATIVQNPSNASTGSGAIRSPVVTSVA